MTLQDYLFWEYHSDPMPKIDYSMRVFVDLDGSVSLYIHPTGRDGSTTPTLKVQGNSVVWPTGDEHGRR